MDEILKKVIMAAAKARSHKIEKVIKTLEEDVLQGDESALKLMALLVGAMANFDEDDAVVLTTKELARRMKFAASQQQKEDK